MAGVKKEGKDRKRQSDEVVRRSPVRASSAAAASSEAGSELLGSDGDLALASTAPPPQAAAAAATLQMHPPPVPAQDRRVHPLEHRPGPRRPPLGRQREPLADPEPMLLVHHREAEVGERVAPACFGR